MARGRPAGQPEITSFRAESALRAKDGRKDGFLLRPAVGAGSDLHPVRCIATISRQAVTVSRRVPELPSVDLRRRVEQVLAVHHVKATPQRIEIGAVLLARDCHMSADQVLKVLRDAGSRISKATVYNTLNLFSRNGIVREVAYEASRLVYDSNTQRHHHLYNEDTGEFTDLDPRAVQISQLPPLPPGTEAASIDVVIRIRRRRDQGV